MPQFHDPDVPVYNIRFPDKEIRQRFHAMCVDKGTNMRQELLRLIAEALQEHDKTTEKPK